MTIFRKQVLIRQSTFIWIFMFGFGFSVLAQPRHIIKKVNNASQKFSRKVSNGTGYRFKVDTVIVNTDSEALKLEMGPVFSYIPFRPENVADYYNSYRKLLHRKFRKYSVTITCMGKDIRQLIPNYYRGNFAAIDSTRLPVPAKSRIPIVRNISQNFMPQKGLYDRNIAVWPSHGWYYSNKTDRWEWQRARIFLTVEDLWTMSFVVPYITPMLENAGAHVFLPRERDVRKQEIIVDNDGSTAGSEYLESGDIVAGNAKGFGLKVPFLLDGENPFQMGTCRVMKASESENSKIVYTPDVPETGDYAVYVSYAQNGENVTDARYSVFHSGGKTDFLVNQTEGGGTWIYLGTFRFEKGIHPEQGAVVLTNESRESGRLVSADAVRFGGGMGNVARGSQEAMDRLRQLRDEKGFALDSAVWAPFVSQRPRYEEGARYYLQYSGMPDTLVYSINHRKDDYRDDYQSRGEWVDYLLGAPNGPSRDANAKGLGIPVDLSMAFHTDAGTTPDSTIIGSLMIYDTTLGADHFLDGQSRWTSRDLADIVQTQVVSDIQKLWDPEWTRRGMWNKQYSEAARPKVPTILSEVMSHQNFADMLQANDPRFKFDMSRAFYKGILKYIASQNKQEFVVEPLPVDSFQLIQDGKNIRLKWSPVNDPLEPTAVAKSYKVYTRVESGGFDNGQIVDEPTVVFSDLKPGVIYSFKVTALNDGGESFPSEILACSLPADNRNPVLIVNAFDRICGPEAFDNGKEAGFLTCDDEGVAWKYDLAFVGDQYDFNRKSPFRNNDACGFGSSYADQETRVVPGNSFDYPFVHGKAFRDNGLGFISMSAKAFSQKKWDKNAFAALDIIFGEQKTTRRLYGLRKTDFTVFTPEMRDAISAFLSGENPKLLISGAYIGTDLSLCGDTLAPKFAKDILHFRFVTNHGSRSGKIFPVNAVWSEFPLNFDFVQGYNPEIYKVESPDVIEPAGENTGVLFRYADGNKTAGVCFDEKYHCVSFGFPLESISTQRQLNELIGEVLIHWRLK